MSDEIVNVKIGNKAVVLQALEQVEMLRKARSDLRRIQQLANSLQWPGLGPSVDVGNVDSVLMQKELESWNQVFMFGLTLDEDGRDRIKAAAYDMFLKNAGPDWITKNGMRPSAYMESELMEFREMARKAFMPSGMSES